MGWCLTYVLKESHLAGEQHRPDGGFSAEKKALLAVNPRYEVKIEAQAWAGQLRSGERFATKRNRRSSENCLSASSSTVGGASKPESIRESNVIIMLPKDIAGDMVF